MLVNKLSEAVYDLHSVRFFKPRNALAQACNNRILVFGKLCKIKPDLTGCYTAGRSIQRRLINFRTMQQCFCGNAAAVQTCSAQIARLNKRRVFAVLCAAYSRFITARARAQNNDIIIVFAHYLNSLSFFAAYRRVYPKYTTNGKIIQSCRDF